MGKKILVINAGSSSIKYQLIDMKGEKVVAKGICERIGLAGSLLKHKGTGDELRKEAPMPTHNEAIKMILDALTDKDTGVIKSLKDISAIGHRVVHGGEVFKESALIDEGVIKEIQLISDLAPLHNPPNIIGIRACQAVMPKAPQVAVFDTSFHTTMPKHASMYGIKYEDYEAYKIRKYGFHGTSHLFVSAQAIKLTKGKAAKIVTCHLGNGASVAAVKDGKCIDTSMGLTPLEGLIMGTRSGDIDAAVLEYLMQKKGYTISEATNYLNKQSGVAGISGISSDFRDLVAAMQAGNERAELAIDMFSYRVLKYIGSYAAAMNGIDCLVFTGGIGENTPQVRERICKNLSSFGIKFDNDKNYNFARGQVNTLSMPGSKVKVLIIPTNEELVIARETQNLTK